jgi:fatty acid desaturase
MKCNVGMKERMVRIIVAIIAIGLGYLVSPWFYIITLIGFGTALLGYCPVSHLLGINTCMQKNTGQKL